MPRPEVLYNSVPWDDPGPRAQSVPIDPQPEDKDDPAPEPVIP